MKKFIFGILLAISACSWAAAESSVWKAQKGATVIYLGGTCHVLRPTDYPLPPEFDRAYRAADTVVFETDIGKLNEPETLRNLLLKSVYADGSTLDRHLSAVTYGKLQAYCEAKGIPLGTFRQMKPAMLMETLMLMELEKLGVNRQGVDQYFYALAVQDRKNIEKFETVDEQLNYVISMADGNEDEFVSCSLTDMGSLRQQFDTLANAWRHGNTGKLEELLFAELKTRQPVLYKRLLTDRNNNWLPTIETYGKSSRIRFVLVGVSHLVGDNGLIEALRKRGYQVDKL